MRLLHDLDAFYQERRPCVELGGGEGDSISMTWSCGAAGDQPTLDEEANR